jgi:peptidyl-prolyl cis-trans isomerase A (cyclophilin A)
MRISTPGRARMAITIVAAVLMCAATAVAAGQAARKGTPPRAARIDPALKDPSQLSDTAPETFRTRVVTSKGTFVIEVQRDWAPLAADRFYNLVKHGFYDQSRFFRVLDGFMAQFGLHADPEVQSAWRTAGLADEPVKQSNTRGMVSFAKESVPNSRFTMVFVNYKDNSYLDADGFAPFGQIVTGMPVVDMLYSGYGRTNVPDQRRIVREGNVFLTAEYPKLDFIRTATIEASR